MAKLISVSDEVYARLSLVKNSENARSFTQVILALLGKREEGLSDLFGKLKMSDTEADKFAESVKLGRKNFLGSD